MTARVLAMGLAAAGCLLPLVPAAAVETATSAPLVQSGPRIIQIPEPPKAEPKRRVEAPQKRPEAAKPGTSQPPATPSLRAPVPAKTNRKIWI